MFTLSPFGLEGAMYHMSICLSICPSILPSSRLYNLHCQMILLHMWYRILFISGSLCQCSRISWHVVIVLTHWVTDVWGSSSLPLYSPQYSMDRNNISHRHFHGWIMNFITYGVWMFFFSMILLHVGVLWLHIDWCLNLDSFSLYS